jgi:hypothetical protein
MTASEPVISNLLEFIDNCAIDDYLLMVSNHDLSEARARVSFDVSGRR